MLAFFQIGISLILPLSNRRFQPERMGRLERYFSLNSFSFAGPILALTELWAGEHFLCVITIWTPWMGSLSVLSSEATTTLKLIGSKKLNNGFLLTWITGCATSISRLVGNSIPNLHPPLQQIYLPICYNIALMLF